MLSRPLAEPCSLIDTFGRRISYLRLSVTDRCDLRCVYCMSETMKFLSRREVMSLEEIERLAHAFIRIGVRKIRLTGGEPLMRKGVMDLFRRLSEPLREGRLRELTLTTNATRLAQYADELAHCGVRRINVSLDTLDPVRFAAVTRGGTLSAVLEGIEAARRAGLKVKINTVALRGGTETEIDDLIHFAHDRGMTLSLIETMPLGETGSDRLDQYLPLTILRGIIETRWSLEDVDVSSGGPARYARIAQTGGLIGFITPLTHNFCESCNRVRVTASGVLHTCLGQEDAIDLKSVMRASGSDGPLLAAIADAIASKPKGHDFVIDRNNRPSLERHMSATGG